MSERCDEDSPVYAYFKIYVSIQSVAFFILFPLYLRREILLKTSYHHPVDHEKHLQIMEIDMFVLPSKTPFMEPGWWLCSSYVSRGCYHRVNECLFKLMLLFPILFLTNLPFIASITFVLHSFGLFFSLQFPPYRSKQTTYIDRLFRGMLAFLSFLALVHAQKVRTPFTLPTRLTYLVKLSMLFTLFTTGLSWAYWVYSKSERSWNSIVTLQKLSTHLEVRTCFKRRAGGIIS